MRVIPLYSEIKRAKRRRHIRNLKNTAAIKVIILIFFLFSTKTVAKEIQIAQIDIENANVQLKDPIQVDLGSLASDELEFSLLNKNTNQPVEVNIEVVESAAYLIPTADVLPGKYEIQIKDGSRTIFDEEFLWGVLALNINKATYVAGDKASISIAVLDETGMMVCDANLRLQIKSSATGALHTLSTEEGTIKVNKECEIHDFTNNPDYETTFDITDAGKYELTLSAQTKNGSYEIYDSFEATANVPYDVERNIATRIFPLSKYPVSINVKFNENFKGKIIESVPNDFLVLPAQHSTSYDEIKPTSTVQELIWHVDVKAGETLNLGYYFDAPDVSPEFYLLGPLRLVEMSEVINGGLEITEIETNDLYIEQPLNEQTINYIHLRQVLAQEYESESNAESSGSENLESDNFFESLDEDTDESSNTYKNFELLNIEEANLEQELSTDTHEQATETVQYSNEIQMLETEIFSETRQWQLAIDSVPAAGTATAVDATILAGNEIHDGEGRHVVTIGRDTVYVIFTDGTGIVSYYKSTNGGVSWGSVVTVTAQTDSQNIGVWYDGWTPGLDTGLIHIVWGETGGDDIYYDYIDTQNSDSQRGEVVAIANSGATHTAITDSISVTRATDGDVYVMFSSNVASSVTQMRYTTDLGANWSTAADEGIDDVSGDWVNLMPLANGDVLLLRWDLSANTILSREYEDATDDWEGDNWPSAFANTANDQTNFTEVWGATLDPSNNNIYFAYINDAGLSTSDILTYSYDGSSWTAGGTFLTDITTLQGIAVGYDTRNDDIYVAYNRGTAEANLSPFYKISTDGGANWGPQIGAVSLAAVDDYKSMQMNIMSDEQFVLWVQDDDDNDMFQGLVADLGVQGRATNFTYIEGFEDNDVNDASATNGTPTAPNTNPRTGDYSLQINPTSATEYATFLYYAGTNGSPSSTDIDMMTMNVALYIDDDPSVNATILQILDSTNATVATVQLETSTRQLNLIATNTASGSTNLSEDTWYILGLYLDSDNSAQELRIYSNDMKTLYETLTLTDTIVDFNQLRIGLMTSSTGILYFDDWIAYAGDLAIDKYALVANYAIKRMDLDSNGASTAFATGGSCSGCTPGNDWEWVDDIPNDNASYTESASIGAAETYGLESASSAGIEGEIHAVKGMTTRWESTSGTSGGVAVRITANSTNSDSASINASATAGTDYFRLLPNPPGTGQPLWTASLLDGMEIGQTQSTSVNVRFGRAEVEVLYIPTIDISGTCDTYDQSTDCGDTGTVRVAINGLLQEQKQTTVAGTWTIADVPAPSAGDVITVFIDGASNSDEAVAVTKYSGSGDITGINLYKEHLSIGSDDNQTITNTNLSQFDNSVSGDEDIFFDISSGNLTVDSLGQSSQEELIIKSGNTYQPGGNVSTHDMEIVGTFVPEANTVTIGGSYLNSGTLTAGTSSFIFNSSSTGETIVSGGTGATKNFYDIQLNNSSGGWTIQTNNLTAARNFTITDTAASGFTVDSVTLEVDGAYSIADAETANSTWTSATLYLNSGTAYTVGGKTQSAETYSTLQIGANTDIRMWNSSATTTTVDSSGSLYSQDHANTNGDLYIWGDYHTQTNDYWSYATDFDGTNLSGGSERQVDVRIDPAAGVTIDSDDTLASIGTSGNRTTVSRQGGSNGYSITSVGATLNFQYTDFDYLDGPTGLDIQASSTVTSLDNTKFDNMMNSGTDAFITVASTVIGSGTKTIAGVQFDNTGSGADCNVNRTGSDDTGYWDFDTSSGTFDGEGNDCKAGVAEDDPGMIRWDDSTGSNQSPNTPSSLAQKKTDDTVLSTGDWTDETSVKFTVTASDPDANDTLYLCVERDTLGTAFSDTEDSCGDGVAYSGSPVTLTHTVSSQTDASEYHWQVRVKDAASAYSAWVQYGGNAESARDYGIDSTAPTGGTIYDGTETSVDHDFNDGSLSSLSANWSGFNTNASGLLRYDYSIGTTVGGTDVRTWTSNTTSTSVTATSLTLNTSQVYYFNVRAVDNAGNIQSPVISSDGQIVAPTLTFTVSPSTVTFSNLNAGNSYNDTETTTLTTSTNAYNGYVVRAYIGSLLTSTIYPGVTIPNFTGGTYASPDEWLTGDRGFGYTSSDTSVQGSNLYGSTPCAGGGNPTCYAPFATSGPGDIVADHTSTVTGTPISDESFTITYQVKTDASQAASPYSTTVIYTITPQY